MRELLINLHENSQEPIYKDIDLDEIPLTMLTVCVWFPACDILETKYKLIHLNFK